MIKENTDIEIIRHSLAHVMAAAVKILYPEALFGVGPNIENGFYYDIDLERKISLDDLKKIEKKMREIIKKKLPFDQRKITREEALSIFHDQPYKIELINELEDDEISIYRLGDFSDLCRGPHVPSTEMINPQSFSLSSVAGAYWRGDEKRPMLQRIYGYAFRTKQELENFLIQLEEAQKRDHRLIGKKLDLFHFDEKLGSGLVLWPPKGAILKKIIQDFILDKCLQNGYHLVDTPHIARLHLWQTSGHTDFYKDSMFPAMHLKEISEEEKDDYQVKPMNCPFHILTYQRSLHSYRELPLRYAELGTVYRYEKSGVLHGLTRVRGFTQDDAHIWCTSDQLPDEIEKTLKLALEVLGDFGFKQYDIYLSTQPRKYIGDKKIWTKATDALKQALQKQNIEYKIDEAGGVFYGPKIDIKIKDSIGRSWQCTTIQVDFNLPEKFNMFFVNAKGEKEQPIMIHRALLGSIERFIGVLLEHYGGQLPLWLSPTQVIIIPIADRHIDYAQQISDGLRSRHFRVDLDVETKTMNKKILQAEERNIPFIIVIGDREIEKNEISVREKGKSELKNMTTQQFLSLLEEKISKKS